LVGVLDTYLGVFIRHDGRNRLTTFALACRPDTDEAYDADYAALQSALSDQNNMGAVYAITVGSEALYRGSLTAQQLLSKIQNMTAAYPNVLVGTADSWNKFQDGTADPIIQGGTKLMYECSPHDFSYTMLMLE
jgi:exo-beta-1,3-glucanase (GH17 family)